MPKRTVAALVAVLATLAACHSTPHVGPGAYGPGVFPSPSPTRVPLAGGLVDVTEPDEANFAVQVPASWKTTADCSGSSASLCSVNGKGNTDQDVWFDPTDTGRRLTVIGCLGAGCSPVAPTGAPLFPAPIPGAATTQTVSTSELSFTMPAGPHDQGPYPIDGLFVASLYAPLGPTPDQTKSAGQLTFPVFTVTVSLPGADQALAAEIVHSFQVLYSAD